MITENIWADKLRLISMLFDCQPISWYGNKKRIPKRLAGIYIACDAQLNPLYVGQSTDVHTRLKYHEILSPLAGDVAAIGFIPVEQQPQKRLLMEAVLIWLMKPQENRKHNIPI